MTWQAWRAAAACLGADTNLFHPWSKGAMSHDAVKPAASFCARCPVTDECLREALRETPYKRRGIWGGWLFRDSGSTTDVLDVLWWAGLADAPRPGPVGGWRGVADEPEERGA